MAKGRRRGGGGRGSIGVLKLARFKVEGEVRREQAGRLRRRNGGMDA